MGQELDLEVVNCFFFIVIVVWSVLRIVYQLSLNHERYHLAHLPFTYSDAIGIKHHTNSGKNHQASLLSYIHYFVVS